MSHPVMVYSHPGTHIDRIRVCFHSDPSSRLVHSRNIHRYLNKKKIPITTVFFYICYASYFKLFLSKISDNISIVKPTRCTNVSNLFYFGMTLYMFWAVFPSIIRSSRLYRGADKSLARPGRKQATFPTFYGTWRFITTFTTVHHLSLP